jgi:hypothetical protein
VEEYELVRRKDEGEGVFSEVDSFSESFVFADGAFPLASVLLLELHSDILSHLPAIVKKDKSIFGQADRILLLFIAHANLKVDFCLKFGWLPETVDIFGCSLPF